jgi:hypothetical protein
LTALNTQGVAALTRMLLGRTQPKRIGSQIVTGPVLAGLAEAYCEAINAGAVPTISTAWQVRGGWRAGLQTRGSAGAKRPGELLTPCHDSVSAMLHYSCASYTSDSSRSQS